MASKKKSKPKKDTTPYKPFTKDDLHLILRDQSRLTASPDTVLNKMTDILNQYEGATEEKKDELNTKHREISSQALAVFNLDNHLLLASSTTSEEYRTFAIEFANQIIKNYECKTPVEKSLAHTISSAYIRMMEYSALLSRVKNMEYITDAKIRYYGMLGKEIDRANRQYLSALSALSQIKSPKLAVTVKTQAAFVANNQQINATPEKPQGEIIDGG